MLLIRKITIVVLIAMFSLVAQEEKRCAVDIGSGWIKMQMALVNNESNQIITLLDEPFLSYVPLANYYAQDGKLNLEIQNQAIGTFDALLKICKQKNITKLAGVATEVFRKAGDSGLSLFNTLKSMAQKQFGDESVNLQIISQELEGRFGFLTAAALCPECNITSIASWDSGNASFQFVIQDTSESSNYITYEGKLGSATAAKLFVESIRNQPYKKGMSVNPVEPREIEKFVELASGTIVFSEMFIKKLHDIDIKVIGIGGPSSMFALASKVIGRTVFSRKELRDIVYFYAQFEQSSPHISGLDSIEPETVITRLMLLCAVMQKFSIDNVTYKASNGSTLGILLYPQLWNR